MESSIEAVKVPRFRVTTVAFRVSRYVLASFFAYSGMIHLQNPFFFLDSIIAYSIVSGLTAVIAAALLPIVELLVAIYLFVDRTGGIPHIVTWVLLMTFLLSQVSVIARGITIDCGCFGSVTRREVGFESILLIISLMCLNLLGHIFSKKNCHLGAEL